MRTLILSLAALMLVASSAHGQVPSAPTPTYTLEIQNTPGEFGALDVPNATATAPYAVVLTLSNVICTAAVDIPVTLTATAASAPSNLVVAVEPSQFNITITAGPHGSSGVGSPAGGTGDGVVRASVVGNITANASATVTLVATAPAPAGCQGAGTFSDATSAPVSIFANLTAPPPPPPVEPPAEDTPFLGALALAGVIALVALGRRRTL